VASTRPVIGTVHEGYPPNSCHAVKRRSLSRSRLTLIARVERGFRTVTLERVINPSIGCQEGREPNDGFVLLGDWFTANLHGFALGKSCRSGARNSRPVRAL
jgi:hypothetical protein